MCPERSTHHRKRLSYWMSTPSRYYHHTDFSQSLSKWTYRISNCQWWFLWPMKSVSERRSCYQLCSSRTGKVQRSLWSPQLIGLWYSQWNQGVRGACWIFQRLTPDPAHSYHSQASMGWWVWSRVSVHFKHETSLMNYICLCYSMKTRSAWGCRPWHLLANYYLLSRMNTMGEPLALACRDAHTLRSLSWYQLLTSTREWLLCSVHQISNQC